ncbi:protein-disulfide reductase DsbD [Ideonella margarita]|uniref:Thiol:disulfide interchange protein DsbD n=1 Tax=Ideonella margarita TaxID=2984191 RepID=A0ABU9C9I3_9BURK
MLLSHKSHLRSLLAIALMAFSALFSTFGVAAADFLEPEQAFKLSGVPEGDKAVRLRFDIAPGYYLYRDKFQFAAVAGTLGEPALPKGKVKFDANFQKEVETYRDSLEVVLPVTQAGAKIDLDVTLQGCADAGLCYPPLSRTLVVSLAGYGGNQTVAPKAEGGENAADQSSTSSVAPGGIPGVLAGATGAQNDANGATGSGSLSDVERVLRSGSWWTTVGAFWVMGLLLAFTPCVLPMLPILSSIIAGGGQVSRKRGFAMAFAYSLGMSLVYTALGVAAGLAGEGLAAALQKPGVLAAFGLLLVLLSLSMFDVYELRLPSALATRLDGASRRLPGGQWLGVFLMGGLSALIVSPCVTGPLAGALVFLSQTRDVTLAGSALFALAWGMSVPLLLLGASAGTLLPRSGAWMHAVKRFFGLLLLAVALWIVQPILPSALVLMGWSALLLVVAFMLRPFDAHPHSSTPRLWLQRAAGVAALTMGVLQLVGVASGATDPLQPLHRLARAGVESAAAHNAGLKFQPVRSVAELDQAIAASGGKPVMLDFYADWCVSCKEMERFTFSEPAIQARLASTLLLKADVTANTDDDKALLKRFQLFGPPGTIFFNATGEEVRSARLVGYQSPEDFSETLKKAGL